MFIGKDLKDDPEYQARLKAGEVPPPKHLAEKAALKPTAKISAYLFLAGVVTVVVLRLLPGAAHDPWRERCDIDADRH